MKHDTEKRVPCPGCGARFPDRNGPTHRYLEASPGCWGTSGWAAWAAHHAHVERWGGRIREA